MTSVLTSVWLILMFFLAHWAGSWHWIAFLFIKYVYSKTRPVLSRSIMSILSHAADSSAVLGVYTKKIWSTMLITNRQLEMINTESIPSSSVLEWSFCFSFWIRTWWCFVLPLHVVLTCASRERGEPGRGYTAHKWVAVISVVVVYILNQAAQTDNAKLHVTIYQSNFHCFEWFIQTSSCLAFSRLSLFQLVYLQPLKRGRTEMTKIRIVEWCISYELIKLVVLFLLALPNKCLWVIMCLPACLNECMCAFFAFLRGSFSITWRFFF